MPRILHPDGTFEVLNSTLTVAAIRKQNIDMINSSPIAEAAKQALITNLPCGEVYADVSDIPIAAKASSAKSDA
jgi:hypothetical protein